MVTSVIQNRYSLILLISQLFWTVVGLGCNICNRSMKFKCIHKISLIHKNFLLLFNLLHRLDVIRLGTGSSPGAAICASLL